MTSPARVPFGVVGVDVVDMDRAVALVLRLAGAPRASLVLTPNLHRYDVATRDLRIQTLYARADLVLADGWPLSWALGRRLRRPVSRVSGSDLLPAVLAASCRAGVRVALIGGKDPAAARTAAQHQFPGVNIVICEDVWCSPEPSADEVATFVAHVERAGADVVVLGLGAPKEELLMFSALPVLARGVFLCLGGSLDFMSGDQTRAPERVRRARMEWAWRSVLEPRRLPERYLRPLPAFVAALTRR